MRLDLIVENQGKITLTDKNYLASGGEASVYAKDLTAYKIYHDPAKMIPIGKIKELGQITSKNVLRPQNVIRNSKNVSVGYTMRFIKTTHPLCKLFTKNFKASKKISDDDIVYLIKKTQQTISQIHKDGSLIVDLNELNLLVSAKFDIPYFIDVDSYQTLSYKATALMQSIKDPLVKNNNFTELSDWFGFGILAFQLYIGIHPYRGKHPDYKGNEWTKRMEDGISVFNKDVTLPMVCNDLSVIPKPHLEWFKDLFINNNRSIPPFADVVVTVIPVPETYIEGTEHFETGLIWDAPEKLLSVFDFMGVHYSVGTEYVYKEKASLPNNIKDFEVLLCESSDMTPIICKLKDELLTFEDVGTTVIDTINASKMMYRNGAIYSTYDGKLIENTFDKIGSKIFHKTRVAANILSLSTKVFDGVVFQDLLGKCHITLPYEMGKCITVPVKELNGYRILESRSEKNICGVMVEKGGIYYRFVLVFNDTFTQYTVSKADNVAYAPINLTVMKNGVCIMITDSDVQIFKDNKVKVINNPPFDSTTRLFNSSGTVFFIDGNKIYSAKMK